MDEKENKAKMSSLLNDSADTLGFKEILLNLYLLEFEENIFLILKLRKEFYDYLIQKIKFRIKEKYGEQAYFTEVFIITDMLIQKTFYDDYYTPTYNYIIKNIEKEINSFNSKSSQTRARTSSILTTNLLNKETIFSKLKFFSTNKQNLGNLKNATFPIILRLAFFKIK